MRRLWLEINSLAPELLALGRGYIGIAERHRAYWREIPTWDTGITTSSGSPVQENRYVLQVQERCKKDALGEMRPTT